MTRRPDPPAPADPSAPAGPGDPADRTAPAAPADRAGSGTGEGDGGWPAIGSLAFLSDCRVAALVGPDGAVEWLCAPRFDGASVFGRLLDRRIGGAWELRVEGAPAPRQRYRDTTLLVESRWTAPHGTVGGEDYLAVRRPDRDEACLIEPLALLVRRLTCETGTVTVRHRLDARPDYARARARWSAVDGAEAGVAPTALEETTAGLWLGATATGAAPRVRVAEDGAVTVEAVLRAGEALAVVLGYDGPPQEPLDMGLVDRTRDDTVEAWRAWDGLNDYRGFGADHVRRSALTLRGLMTADTGSLIAAATTSLPEWIGGERNWDYRYLWHRDAALVVLVLMRLGHRVEAALYVRILLDHSAWASGALHPMLDIDGRAEGEEAVLEHLGGYRDSPPVRCGNSAFSQHQLDTYGQVLDAVFVYQQAALGTGRELARDELVAVYQVVDAAARVWREPDDGIWEVRDRSRHWTVSKVYAWVCFDRGVRLAELMDDDRPDLDRWRRERDAVRAEVLDKGWSESVGSFTQSYGSANVDASLLALGLLGFLDGADPRVVATLERVEEELGEDGWLVHRYDPEATDDGINGPEGGFLLSSFAMVSALVLAGRHDEARRRYEEICSRMGRFGLFSEEMARDGTMLGNYPQAFTHLGLIDAAMNLDAAGDEEALRAWAGRRGS
ncbi:glycoside hydrolase family 15 protein [Streptomyces viridosporus]|uniref:glycoside hydrolase family 15 protein n=1 Tax=Streptomyces viridosporus TaxID=67581 RepID=UPI003F65B380